MRKRLFAVLAAVLTVLGLAACDSSTTIDADGSGPGTALVHWQQNVPGSRERVIDVYAEQATTSPALQLALQRAVAQGDRSPFLDFRLTIVPTLPTSCAAPQHCITVRGVPGINGAVNGFGWGAGGHMYGLASQVRFDSNPWPSQAVLDNAACHEVVGHGSGLGHSVDPNTEGPCQAGVLTAADLKNMATTHNQLDQPIWASAPAAQAQAPVGVDEVERTSEAEFVDMLEGADG
jgi:hypothetical protein